MSSAEKRAAAQKAEADFFALLRESGLVKPGAVWKEVCGIVHWIRSIMTGWHFFHCHQIKKNLTADPRYDAVGSSSLREELFNTYIKAGASEEGLKPQSVGSTTQPAAEEDEEERERRRTERKVRAVKEREEKVKVERTKVEAEIDRSKFGLAKEEGELEFRCAIAFLHSEIRCLAPLTADRMLCCVGRCSSMPSGTHRYADCASRSRSLTASICARRSLGILCSRSCGETRGSSTRRYQ